MSQIRTYRPDDPIEDDPRSDSLAPTSQYAPSTINAYPQHHQETSSIAHHEHDPPTAPISELADEDAMPTDTFPDGTPVRTSTLKKKASVKRGVSVASSRRSVRMPAAKRNDLGPDFWNALNIPIPTTGNPTEALANRFQAWRKLLKDLVVYFREIQVTYDVRAKATQRMSNVINATNGPPELLRQGGINDAIGMLRNFNRIALAEANRAKEIEEDVIGQLNLLRNDLNQKIREIKGLSGDFKNSVERERDNSRRMVESLNGALRAAEHDPVGASGKGDPFILRLGVDRQVEKQIDEENYLHRAYLNLENSGRELESIIVGEIQKAYNAYATILNKEVTTAHNVVDELRTGPIAMPKDHEWSAFVEHSSNFVNPGIPVRSIQNIFYPGQDSAIACEIRGGPLERKSKYLKSYTPGWYVLSPTHLHEFKTADHINSQQPVMSLYLLDQKLGSHSQVGASSHKFSLKGRQTGSMHRGHSWVFRAESYDTMLAWFNDIKALTEKSGQEKLTFVKAHARNVSGASKAFSAASEGMQDDDADAVPFAAPVPTNDATLNVPKRPEAGGRIPSDLSINRSSDKPAAFKTDDIIIPGSEGMTSHSPAAMKSRDVSSTRGQNATSNFQRPAEFPDRYRDNASTFTGARSRPTSNYYPEPVADTPMQQNYQEEPIPSIVANQARPRSTMAHSPQQQNLIDPVPVSRFQEDIGDRNNYTPKSQGSRAASAHRTMNQGPRPDNYAEPARQRPYDERKNRGSRNTSAQQSQTFMPPQRSNFPLQESSEMPTDVNVRGAPGYSTYDNVPDEADVVAGAAGGAVLGVAGAEMYSRFNRPEEPVVPFRSEAEGNEAYGHVPIAQGVEHQETGLQPEHVATVHDVADEDEEDELPVEGFQTSAATVPEPEVDPAIRYMEEPTAPPKSRMQPGAVRTLISDVHHGPYVHQDRLPDMTTQTVPEPELVSPAKSAELPIVPPRPMRSQQGVSNVQDGPYVHEDRLPDLTTQTAYEPELAPAAKSVELPEVENVDMPQQKESEPYLATEAVSEPEPFSDVEAVQSPAVPSRPQTQQGPFRILGAEAWDGYYDNKPRQWEPQPQSAPVTAQGHNDTADDVHQQLHSDQLPLTTQPNNDNVTDLQQPEYERSEHLPVSDDVNNDSADAFELPLIRPVSTLTMADSARAAEMLERQQIEAERQAERARIAAEEQAEQAELTNGVAEPEPEPEVFHGDQLPDPTSALAGSNMLSVPTYPERLGDESPTSDYGDNRSSYVDGTATPSSHYAQSSTPALGSQDGLQPSHGNHAPELSSSTLSGTDTNGAITPRASSPTTTVHVQSPYPILAGPAPYKDNPVFADAVSQLPTGSSPTDVLLEEAAHSEGPGLYEKDVEIATTNFPVISRMDTAGTISDLTIPGGFPREQGSP